VRDSKQHPTSRVPGGDSAARESSGAAHPRGTGRGRRPSRDRSIAGPRRARRWGAPPRWRPTLPAAPRGRQDSSKGESILAGRPLEGRWRKRGRMPWRPLQGVPPPPLREPQPRLRRRALTESPRNAGAVLPERKAADPGRLASRGHPGKRSPRAYPRLCSARAQRAHVSSRRPPRPPAKPGHRRQKRRVPLARATWRAPPFGPRARTAPGTRPRGCVVASQRDWQKRDTPGLAPAGLLHLGSEGGDTGCCPEVPSAFPRRPEPPPARRGP